MNSSIAYCMEQVRSRDRDRYWCAMLSPVAYRDDLFALYAFNCEIAEIGASVSEPLIGQMRLRWWLDALPSIFAGDPPKHPVAIALSETMSRRTVQRQLLEHFLETRERDMDKSPFNTISEFTSYAEGTASTLMALSMDIMGSTETSTREMAHSLGIAWAFLGLIRSVPYQLQNGSIQLPLDVCGRYQFDRQTMLDHGYKENPPDGFVDVIDALTVEMQKHLNDNSSVERTSSTLYAAPLLLKVLITGYLKELEQVGNDPFQLNHWRKGPRLRDMIRLKWAALVKSV